MLAADQESYDRWLHRCICVTDDTAWREHMPSIGYCCRVMPSGSVYAVPVCHLIKQNNQQAGPWSLGHHGGLHWRAQSPTASIFDTQHCSLSTIQHRCSWLYMGLGPAAAPAAAGTRCRCAAAVHRPSFWAHASHAAHRGSLASVRASPTTTTPRLARVSATFSRL